MKYLSLCMIAMLGLTLGGCRGKAKRESANVVSKRFIHKYGYDISQEEWETSNVPGQMVTTLRNGVTVVSTYANGELNGPTTRTYPHSQTLQSLSVYENGKLVKLMSYNVRGVPVQEEVYLSPTSTRITKWYGSGTPKSSEEWHGQRLAEAEYYNEQNEVEHRVSKGNGVRLIKNDQNLVTAKETIENGDVIFSETYHANGTPYTSTPLYKGQIHGEKKVFALTGEPLSIENYADGKKHGASTYFQNGVRYLEMAYANGQRDGLERHYVDGQTIIQETQWVADRRHGPSSVYYEELTQTTWYYNNEAVEKDRFNTLVARAQEVAKISQMSRK